MTIKQYRRDLTVNAPALIEGNDERIIEIAFSSEAEYTRTYFTESGEAVQLAEILLHGEENVDLSVINDNASLLWNHDFDRHLGVVVAGSARIDADRVGRALVKFSKVGQLANETYEKVIEGTLSKVSVGYEVISGKPDLARGLFIVDRWRPYELTLCSVPADSSVGVGRSLNTDSENPVEIEGNDVNVEEIKTPTEETREIEVVETVEIQETPEVVTHDNAEFTGTIEATQEIKETENEEGNSDSGNRSSDSESIPQDEINTNTVESEEVKTQEAETVEEEKIEEVEQPFTRSHEDTEEIRAIGKHLNISEDEIQRAIEDKEITVENFKARALNITTESKQFKKSKGDTMENALKKYDLGKAIRSQVTGKKLDGLEAEVHQELAHQAAQRGRAQREGSIFIPTSAMRAGQTVATQAVLNPEEVRHDAFVDLLLENSVLASLGVQTFTGLTAGISVPRLSSRNIENFGFVNEGEAGSEDNGMTFDSVKMNMATYTGGIPLTRQAIINMPSIGDLVASQLLRASRIQLEKAILGGGTVKNAKASIVKQLTDAGKVKTMDLTHANFVKAVAELTDAGASNLKFAMTGVMSAGLETTLKDAGVANGYICQDGKIAGRPVFTSGTMAADSILFGDFSGIAIAEWGNGLELDIDTTSYRNSGTVVLRLFSEIDYAVIDDQALAIIKAPVAKAK
ncbi:phage major capsid protein [Salmonella enterica]|nr:phage major capsid protein [Salmonella enterica]